MAIVLAHFLRVLPSNSHDIGELELASKASPIRGGEMRSLGAGMYNTLSLFNHSCAPCMVRANHGNAVVCIAVRDIRRGEEVTENYGVFPAKLTREVRTSLMHSKDLTLCVI